MTETRIHECLLEATLARVARVENSQTGAILAGNLACRTGAGLGPPGGDRVLPSQMSVPDSRRPWLGSAVTARSRRYGTQLRPAVPEHGRVHRRERRPGNGCAHRVTTVSVRCVLTLGLTDHASEASSARDCINYDSYAYDICMG
jgi:hypothetical protein